MYARRQKDMNRYSDGLYAAFSSLAEISSRDTVVIQLVAFSNPKKFLPYYLDIMSKAGFNEYVLTDNVDSHDGRLWRNVPGRQWHANQKGKLASSQEVVLIHRPK